MISKLASPDLRRSRTLQLKQLYSTDWHVENVRRLPGRSRLMGYSTQGASAGLHPLCLSSSFRAD
jgi:hypothetical protein